ncbi:MAG TPA: LysR family transcriptional regulator [Nocardia sp.]|uniref:LysR family transcriptional regulator n=1 Tax=Nocardia TaxID=1817 RepID=UPI002454D2A1|nr:MULTISPECIES: LysR family transcriptional regulator [Nocardia]HLS75915.1 LysR family transcriptional regulator [Nocardia sp.]
MEPLDLNLLVALDSLLDSRSVTEAARRLHTSPSAMSRTLAKLRRVLGDPLLVRSGRNLVPTPRALELRSEVAALVERGRAVLTPRSSVDPGRLERGFTLRADDQVRTELAGPLAVAVRAEAPGVTLRMLPDPGEGTADLRDGRVDLAVGVLGHTEPEIVTQRLFGDRLVGVAVPDHPLVTGRATVAAYAGAAHLAVSGSGRPRGPIDDRLMLHGRTRRVHATVPDLPSALLAVRSGEFVCPAPAHLAARAIDALGLATFEIPLPLPEITIGMSWHSRNTADGAHRWLRDRVAAVLVPEQQPPRRR